MRFHYIRVFEINFNHVPWTIRVTTPAPGAHHLGTPLEDTTTGPGNHHHRHHGGHRPGGGFTTTG